MNIIIMIMICGSCCALVISTAIRKPSLRSVLSAVLRAVLVIPAILMIVVAVGICPQQLPHSHAISPVNLVFPADPQQPIGITVPNRPEFSMYLPFRQQLHYREVTGSSGYIYRARTWCVKVSHTLPSFDFACDRNSPVNPMIEPNIGWPPQVLTFLFNLPQGWYLRPIDTDMYASNGKVVPISGSSGDLIGIFAPPVTDKPLTSTVHQPIVSLSPVGSGSFGPSSSQMSHSTDSHVSQTSQRSSSAKTSSSPQSTVPRSSLPRSSLSGSSSSRSSLSVSSLPRSSLSGSSSSRSSLSVSSQPRSSLQHSTTQKTSVDFSRLVNVLVIQAFARCVRQEFYHLKIVGNSVILDQQLIGDNCQPHFPPILQL